MAPNKIDSNSTGLAFAEEATLKTLPGGPIWYALEPNSYPDFGANYSTVQRSPITNTRQQAKGTITDMDAKGGMNIDLTQRNVVRLLQGFFFQDAAEKPATNKFNSAAIPFTGVATGPSKYNAAAGLGIFLTNHLAMAKNFGNPINNGLFLVSGTAAGFIQTAKALAVEVPPAAASVEAVGFQFAASDLVLTAVGGTFVLTSAAFDLATLSLQVGEWIYVGGDGAGFQFPVAGPFFGRIKAINGGATPSNIVLDLVIGAAVAADAGAAKTIQIFFGKVLANAIVPANIKRRSYQLERQLGNDGNGVQAEYLLGSIPNEVSINLKQSSKLEADLTFVGLDVGYNAGVTGIKAGTRVPALGETAFNTTHDLLAMRLAVIDPASANPTALFAYATDAKIGIKNGVTADKALAVLGGFDASVGNFVADGTMTVYFSTVAALSAIRNNADVCLTAAFAKQNAGFLLDIPLLQLGNGVEKIEKDKPVTVDLTTAAAMNAAGYTAMMVFFEYLPTIAMPV